MSELARVHARWRDEANAKRLAAEKLADGTRPARDCFVSVADACGVDAPVAAFKPVHYKDHKMFKTAEPLFEAAANDPRELLKGGDADDKILASGETTCSELEIAMRARLGMGLRQVSPSPPPLSPTSDLVISTKPLPRIGAVHCPHCLLLSLLQMMVMAQGRTVMVDVPPGTAVAQFEVLVADRTGLPLGMFGLYRGGHPLRALEGCFTIELKTRGRGGGDYGSEAGDASILGRTDSPAMLGTVSTNDPGGHMSFFDRCCTCFTALSSEAPTVPLIEAVTLEQQVYERAEGELVTTGGRSGSLPHEIYTALTKLDDGLVEALRAGDIRLVRSEWFLALSDGDRIQRRQDLEALAPASPLLTTDEAVALLRQGNRGVGSLTYGCAHRDSTLRRTPRSA